MSREGGRGASRSDTGPFTLIPEWVLYHPDLHSTSVRVYGALGRHADNKGEAWPSRRRLAALMGVSTNTIDRALRQLEDVGALTVEARYDEEGDQTSNRYYVHRLGPPLPTDGETPLGIGGDTPLPMDGEQNESTVELEHLELLAPAPQSPRAARARDDLWDAMVAEFYGDSRDLTASARGALNKAVKELRDVEADAAEIPARRQMYAVLYPGAAQTPSALVKHWAACRPDLARLPKQSPMSPALMRVVATMENE